MKRPPDLFRPCGPDDIEDGGGPFVTSRRERATVSVEPNPVRSDPVRLVEGAGFELYGKIPVVATRTLGTWRLWRRSDPNGPGLAGWRVEPSGGLVELVRDRDGNVTAMGRSALTLHGLRKT